MSLKKEDITALTLDDKIKTDLLGLLTEIDTKESELVKMRASAPTDSQTVVSKVDQAKFEAATTELAALKETMAAKLGEKGGEEGEAFLSAFASFFD